ncbi:MAG: flagellar protein FlaG [Burkholderiales bacterium]|nr:flagellar protein FlaG [Burkholderiales bacterium]
MRIDSANTRDIVPVATPANTGSIAAASDMTDALLQRATEAARSALNAVSSNLQFLFDLHSGRTMVQVIDAETRKVIRQLPSEEALAITQAIDRLQSLLVRDQA